MGFRQEKAIHNFVFINMESSFGEYLFLQMKYNIVTKHALSSLLRLLATSSHEGLVARLCRSLLVGRGLAERACRARGSLYCRTRGRGRGRPGFVISCSRPGRRTTGGLILFDLLSCFCSPYHRPLLAGPKSHVRPQEEKSARCCRFESHKDSEFIVRNSAFYETKLLSIGQLHTT